MPLTETSPAPGGLRTDAAPSRPPLRFLPESATSPLCLVWFALLPQLLLLVLNARSFALIWGDMSLAQQRLALCVVGGELALLGLAGTLAVRLWAKQERVSGGTVVALLVSAAVYLGGVCSLDGALIPRSVAQWIVRPEAWLYDQFMLVSPAAFYALVRASDMTWGESRLVRVGGLLVGSLFLLSLPLLALRESAGTFVLPVFGMAAPGWTAGPARRCAR